MPAPEAAQRVGPALICRGIDGERLLLTALCGCARDAAAPVLETERGAVEAEQLHARASYRLLRYRFSLPTRETATYRFDGADYPVHAAHTGDLRVAFVSCNGMEVGDRKRDTDERDRLWHRLTERHAQRPFHLMLHGGDQLYADEMLAVHPEIEAWAQADRHDVGGLELSDEARERMRDYLFGRYMELYGETAPAWLMARVPSLAMWDDHDICDGWGSLAEETLDAPAGRDVFNIAREFFLLFQFGTRPDEAPPAICRDRTGRSLSWDVALPDLHVMAPDLRSERRPHRVMDANGWSVVGQQFAEVSSGRVLLVSSVPALGPRLAWVEAAMGLIPGMQRYEDDLRDQWQSHRHRDEWRRFLRGLLAVHEKPDTRLTVLSGEIHLAARATMAASTAPLHQLVASGITHPPPPGAYARALGALAWAGESPLADHPIRLHPLPGQRRIYTAERNYLVLERNAGAWQAWWELEHSGATPALNLD